MPAIALSNPKQHEHEIVAAANPVGFAPASPSCRETTRATRERRCRRLSVSDVRCRNALTICMQSSAQVSAASSGGASSRRGPAVPRNPMMNEPISPSIINRTCALRGIKLDRVPYEQRPQRDADCPKQQSEWKENPKRLRETKAREDFCASIAIPAPGIEQSLLHAKNGQPNRRRPGVRRVIGNLRCQVSR